MIAVQVDSYPGGVLATLAPDLWLLVKGYVVDPPTTHQTLTLCSHCRQYLHTYALWPDEPQMVLSCGCLALVYGPPVTEVQLLAAWSGFRWLKRRIESRLVPLTNN